MDILLTKDDISTLRAMASAAINAHRDALKKANSRDKELLENEIEAFSKFINKIDEYVAGEVVKNNTIT